jgi:hypothetical protein
MGFPGIWISQRKRIVFMNPLYYIFYRFYKLTERSADFWHPAFVSSIILGVLIYINISTFIIIIVKLKIVSRDFFSSNVLYFFFFFTITFFIFIFQYKKRYLKIAEYFDSSEKVNHLPGSIGFVLYIILTFILFFMVGSINN